MRVLLTILDTVVSREPSFNKLKLIKTYLCSTMTQDRLSSLATISIENDIANQSDLTKFVERFAKAKARRKNLTNL